MNRPGNRFSSIVCGVISVGMLSGCSRAGRLPCIPLTEERAVTRRTSTQSLLVQVPCLDRPLTVFSTVARPMMLPGVTPLCSLIPSTPGMEVLDIGTGSGILALAALQRGARRVVATDINPSAIENVRYNAAQRGWQGRLEARLVSPEHALAYAVIGSEERFDLIVSNPPFWEGTPKDMTEAAVLDEDHQLVRSLIAGLRGHLKPGGKLLLEFWGPAGMMWLRGLTRQYDLQVRIVSHSDVADVADLSSRATAVGQAELLHGDDASLTSFLGGIFNEIGPHYQMLVIEVSPTCR